MTTVNPTDADQASLLASALRNRAARLRHAAGWILTIIVGVLLAGIAVFATAGALASRETNTAVDESRRSLVEILQKQRSAADSELSRLTAQRDKLRDDLTKEVAGIGYSRRLGNGPVSAAIQHELNDVLDRIRSLQVQISNINQRIPELTVPASTSIPKEAQYASLISAISTRIGAILLLLFLVQVLVPLYKYDWKLAAHYESCADAIDLLLATGQSLAVEGFVRITSALSSANVEFGVAPATPTDQALRLVADILAKK